MPAGTYERTEKSSGWKLDEETKARQSAAKKEYWAKFSLDQRRAMLKKRTMPNEHAAPKKPAPSITAAQEVRLLQMEEDIASLKRKLGSLYDAIAVPDDPVDR